MEHCEENKEEGIASSKASNRGVYSKFFVYAIAALLFAFFSGFIFVKNYVVKTKEYKDKIAQFEALKSENEQLQRENEALEQQIDYLKSTSGVESVAREKLGLIKPSEVAFVVVNDKKNPPLSQSKTGADIPKPHHSPVNRDNSGDKDEGKNDSEGWLQKIWNNIFGR